MAPADLGDERVADHGSGPHQAFDQGLGVVGAGGLPAVAVELEGPVGGAGEFDAAVDQGRAGTARGEVPTANSMPTKAAPPGTGAVPVLVSGPEMLAYARPPCS